MCREICISRVGLTTGKPDWCHVWVQKRKRPIFGEKSSHRWRKRRRRLKVNAFLVCDPHLLHSLNLFFWFFRSLASLSLKMNMLTHAFFFNAGLLLFLIPSIACFVALFSFSFSCFVLFRRDFVLLIRSLASFSRLPACLWKYAIAWWIDWWSVHSYVDVARFLLHGWLERQHQV